jgi:hypothetical protein
MWTPDIEHLFDRSTTASDCCCDANRGRFNDWESTMDELDAFECEVDTEKEALVSKLAMISLMDREARIDDWSDRGLMPRLALVLSLEEGGEVVEDRPDDGGVDSKLAVISLALTKVDVDDSAEVADEDMELFVTLDVAVAAAAAAARRS